MPCYRRSAASAVALLILSQPLAALTAQQAWEGWKDLTEAYGQQVVTGSERYSGDTLVVTDARFTLTSDEDDLRVVYTVPRLAFAEQGDGSVQIAVSDSYEVSLSATDDSGSDVSGTFTVSHPGLTVTATDAGQGARYAYAAPAATVQTGPFTEDGAPVDLDLRMGIGPFSGAYTTGTADSTAASFEGAEVDIALFLNDVETDTTVTGEMRVASLSVTSESAGGTLFGANDLATQIAEGMQSDLQVNIGAGEFDFDFDEAGEAGSIAGTFDGSTLAVSLDPERLDYAASYDAFALTLSGSDIPLPEVTMAMDGFELGLDMPLSPSGTASPFALRAALEGVSLGDAVWNLFDPAAVLPRGNAALVLDLAGTGRWLVDITSPEAEGADEPAEIETLSVNQILLRIAGAEMTAEGDFSFDYDDRSTFDGMPRPEGGLSIVLTGANTLLDRLVQMGLLPAEQAMTARMMSGMLLRPGDGPDTLVSDIEVTPSGQITANGAPLPF